jgi:hypothetical protein
LATRPDGSQRYVTAFVFFSQMPLHVWPAAFGRSLVNTRRFGTLPCSSTPFMRPFARRCGPWHEPPGSLFAFWIGDLVSSRSHRNWQRRLVRGFTQNPTSTITLHSRVLSTSNRTHTFLRTHVISKSIDSHLPGGVKFVNELETSFLRGTFFESARSARALMCIQDFLLISHVSSTILVAAARFTTHASPVVRLHWRGGAAYFWDRRKSCTIVFGRCDGYTRSAS